MRVFFGVLLSDVFSSVFRRCAHCCVRVCVLGAEGGVPVYVYVCDDPARSLEPSKSWVLNLVAWVPGVPLEDLVRSLHHS